MVKDINPNPWVQTYKFLSLDGALYFTADDGTHGHELWKSDGSEAGTIMLKDINVGSGSSSPVDFFAFGTSFFFLTYDSSVNGMKLWISDGTEAGTVMV